MKTRILKAVAPLLACVLVVAVCQQADAFPSFGGSCTGCHSNPAGSVNITPNPIGISIGSNGVVTFDITALPGANNAIALTAADLDAAGLDASILAGGDNWTLTSGGYGTSYISDFITSTGPYTLDLGIGAAAVDSLYGIGGFLVGKGAQGTALDFGVNVLTAAIPEPGSILLLLSGSMLCLVGYRRRRDA